jgi:heme exporter protein C
MRILVLLLALGFGSFMGFMQKQDKAKPLWWKVVAVTLLFLSCTFALLTPLGGSFEDVKSVSDIPGKEIMPLNFKAWDFTKTSQGFQFKASSPEHLFNKDVEVATYDMLFNGANPEKLKSGKELIGLARFIADKNHFEVSKITSIDPLFVFPYVPKLEQRIRNLVFHVPMSWIGTLAFALSMAYSISYLRKKRWVDDIKASGAALIGLVLCILATTTGMVWAKYDWGSYWSGDPRQISILVLMIIYFAYFLFRSSIDQEEKRARLSAVYSVFSFLTVVPLVFIIPRQFESLHPGAKGDGTSGPVIDTKAGMLDSELALSFYLSLCAFIIIFFWLFSLYVRYKKLSYNNY